MIAFGKKTQTRIRRMQSWFATGEKINIGANRIVEFDFFLAEKMPVEINHQWWISTNQARRPVGEQD